MYGILIFIGIMGGLLTGMMSVGGGLILIFLLLFIPPFFGQEYTMHMIAGMVIIQSICSGSSGLYSYWKNQLVNIFLLKYLGTSTLVGGSVGTLIAGILSHEQLLAIFAGLSLIATVTMIYKPASADVTPYESKFWAITIGLGIGILGGMFGLGAGFLFMPFMLLLFRIQPKEAVGTGLALLILLCAGALIIKILEHSVPWQEGLFLALGAIPGAQIGSYFGQKMKTSSLRKLMAGSIAVVSVKIWIDLLKGFGFSPFVLWTTFLLLGISILAMVQLVSYFLKRRHQVSESKNV